MIKIRNIILIGKTKNGKSALANVLSGTNDFKEGNNSGSTTKKIQSKEFEIEGVEGEKIIYQVVDTVGICDTALSRKEVLVEIAEACWAVKSGLYQIFF